MDDPTTTARPAIEATVRDYVEGWYAGDASQMERALHDDLVKRTVMLGADGGSVLRGVTKERMVGLTGDGGGDHPGSDYEIQIHHVSENIASARVHSLEYLDYLHLIETADGWKIVNILFRSRE